MNRIADRVYAGSVVALGVAVFLLSRTFPSLDGGYPGPGLFPSIIGIALLCCGILLLVLNSTKSERQVDRAQARPLHMLGLLMALAIGYALAPQVGILPVIAVVVLVGGLLAGVRVIPAVITCAVTTALLYVIFTWLLGVPI